MPTATSALKAAFAALPNDVPRVSHIGFWTDQRGVNGDRFLGSMPLAVVRRNVVAGTRIEYEPGQLQLDLANGNGSPYLAKVSLERGLGYVKAVYVSLQGDYPESIGSHEITDVPRVPVPYWTFVETDYPFGPPTGVTITQFSQTRLDVAWDAPFDLGGNVIDGYKIENSADGITFADLAADTGLTATGYQHTGVFVANTTYYYRVTALDGTVESPVSVVGVVTTGS